MNKNQILADVVRSVKFHFGLTQAEIANKTGITKTYLSDLIGGRSPLSEEYSDKLNAIFGVNREYLRTGVGKMYDGSVSQNNINGDNINGHNVTVNKNGVKMLDEVSKVIGLLGKKDEQIDQILDLLKKKDEQINQVLTLLGKKDE